MIFHIAVCSPDPVLRGRVQRHCMEYYARRADACIVEQLESTAALLQQEKAGSRYELYLIELPAANPCSGLQAAAELRRRGVLPIVKQKVMAGSLRWENSRPKTIICKYKASGFVRVLDGKNVILSAHPVGRFQDLFGFIPKIKGKNPVILTAARVRVRLPARQDPNLSGTQTVEHP